MLEGWRGLPLSFYACTQRMGLGVAHVLRTRLNGGVDVSFTQLMENRNFRLVVVFLMIFALVLVVARPVRAAVGVTSILIPAVIAALEAWGIGTAADGLDGAAIAEWFHEKLTSWETAAGIALENIAIGIKMTPLGQVFLNPVALTGIREFGAWLVQQEGLVAGGSPVQVISGGTTIGGYPVYASTDVVMRDKTFEYTFEVVSGICWAFRTSSTVYFVSTSQFSLKRHVKRLSNGETWSNAASGGSLRNGIYSYGSVYGSSDFVSIPVANYTLADLEASNKVTASSGGSLDIVPSADMDVPTASEVQDKEMVIDAGLDVGADAQAWYDRIMNKVAANDMTAAGTIVNVGTITADQVLDQGAIREEDGVVVWPDVVQPIGVTGLDDIFPFCIPFDIYHFCQALSADPVAPNFDIPFHIDGIVDYTFHLDLSEFDQVAAILRTMELLLFCVGLAFVTRSMFIRG